MGFFNETEQEKKYRELIRALRSSNLDYESIETLVKYLTDVRDGRRLNDFYDFELLQGVIVEIATSNYESHEELIEVFNRILNRVRLLLPQGEKTEDFDAIKREIINYYCSIERSNLFSAELYSLFENRLDYLQIMDIILNDENLTDNFENIVNFAVELGKEVDDQGLLKREIILIN